MLLVQINMYCSIKYSLDHEDLIIQENCKVSHIFILIIHWNGNSSAILNMLLKLFFLGKIKEMEDG